MPKKSLLGVLIVLVAAIFYAGDNYGKIDSYSNAGQLDLGRRGDLAGAKTNELFLEALESLKKGRLLLLSEFVGFNLVLGLHNCSV